MSLKEEWAKLASATADQKKPIQDKINSIEKWCINNKIGNFKEITDFSKPFKMKKTYRFESGRDGGFLIPDGARTGRDRCGACRYNNHSYCGGDKPCLANV